MSLNARQINQQLGSSASATSNLSASCQAILNSYLKPVASPWYKSLNGELQQAQSLASEWRDRFAGELRTDVLMCVMHCGHAFAAQREAINNLFNSDVDFPGANAPLIKALTSLRNSTRMIISAISYYEARLRDWGQRLQQAHAGMNQMVGQIQAEAGDLQARIIVANDAIAEMTAEVIRDRRAIAEAQSKSNSGIVETVFGVLLAPFTGGLSLILAGIGVTSTVEAQSKVSALENTIKSYQERIVASQQMLKRDQAQLVTLNGLLVSGNLALSDVQFAGQMLDLVRTSWEGFFQEMGGVIGKISNARSASALMMEKAWFAAACGEWDAIVTGTENIIGTTTPKKTMACVYCDVPVVLSVPVASQPSVPDDVKLAGSFSGSNLQPSPNTSVLIWGTHTYWIADYVDNRMAMCVLGYDVNNRLVKQVSRNGARHMWQMVYDVVNQQIVCTGQSDLAVNFGLSELRAEESQCLALLQ